MIYRRFGKTEIQMPVLSLGLMRSMYKWQDLPLQKIPPTSQSDLAALISRALELGINHFETARGYGSSERQLGEILQEQPRHKYIIQTKISPCQDPQEFSSQFNDSLARLRLDYVDLLAIHGINDYKTLWYSCRDHGCLAAARRLQAQGKVKHIGFSSHGTPELLAETISQKRDGGFDYLNLHWYYINQTNWPAITMAHQEDMGVFIISPTDKGGMLNTPSEKMKKLCAPLSPMLFNDLFCLSQPEVTTIAIGASTPTDFDEHHKVVALLHNRGNNPGLQIEKNLQEAMRAATGQKRPDWMWLDLPNWDNSPAYMNTPMILWLYNLARGWDLVHFAKRRYQQLGIDMPWVPGNNAAAVNEYDLSKMLDKSPLSTEEFVGSLKEAHTMLKVNPKVDLSH